MQMQGRREQFTTVSEHVDKCGNRGFYHQSLCAFPPVVLKQRAAQTLHLKAAIHTFSPVLLLSESPSLPPICFGAQNRPFPNLQIGAKHESLRRQKATRGHGRANHSFSGHNTMSIFFGAEGRTNAQMDKVTRLKGRSPVT